jgi:hypothetical protein
MHAKGAGDIDGDGFPDLIVAGTGGAIYWYRYPDWTKHTVTTSGGGWSTDLEIADIDDDGLKDIVISDYYEQNRLVWFRNPGPAGTWTMHVIGSPRAHDLEVADLNGDGRLDIVSRGQRSEGSTVWLWQQISPTSWEGRSVATETGEGLHVADVDLDGDPDVITGRYWIENPGDIQAGAWLPSAFSHSWTYPDAAAFAGDINRDGRPDIVLTPAEAAGGNHRISWFEAPVNPHNAWNEHVIDPAVETVHHGLALADMDNDGDLDVTTAEMHQGGDPDEVKVYVNADGSGTSWTKTIVATTGAHNIRVIDIGNDGDLDIFGTNWSGPPRVDLWESQIAVPPSLDTWTYIEADNLRDAQYFGLAARDATGDGFSDIASGAYFYRNPAGEMAGAWTRTSLPLGVDALLMLDVDDDQFADVIAMDSTGAVLWLESTDAIGSAWNTTSIGHLGAADHGISSQGYAIAQVVPGGKPEVIINVPGGLFYLEVPAVPDAGNWPRTTITTTNYPEGISAADLDADGDLDIVGTSDGIEIVWWENPGTGGGEWVSFVVGSLPSAYADRFHAADLNGDGRRDIAVSAANGEADGLYWFEAPPDPRSGGWIRRMIVSQNTTNSMDAADLDRDGDIDLVSGEHRGTRKVAIWENDGAGAFAEHVIDAGKESHLGARLFDLDGDGDLDIVSIAWDEYQYLHVWRNDSPRSADRTPPTIPAELVATTVSTSQIDLTWSASTDDTAVSGYKIFRNGEQIAIVSTTSYSDTGLPANTSYVYSVSAFDADDNESMQSASTIGTTYADGTSPSVPTGLTASAVSASQIDLTWSPSSDSESGISHYVVYRDGTAIHQTGATSFSDSGLTAATTYSYEVSAVNGALLESPRSGPAVATTFDPPPVDSDLAAAYAFDEGTGTLAADASGRGHDGTLSGATWRPGHTQAGLAFEESAQDRVDVGTWSVSGAALTISAWVRFDSFTDSDGRLVTKQRSSAEQDHVWMLSTIDHGGPKLRMRLKTGTQDGSGTTTLIGTTPLATNTWYYVTATYDGAHIRLYLDGALDAAVAKSGALRENDWRVSFGQGEGYASTLDGVLDDVRIYQRALTPAEIQADMQAPVETP